MDLDDLRSAANVICYRLDLDSCGVRIGSGRVSRYVPLWKGRLPHVLISQHEPDQLQALLHELAHHACAERDAQAYKDANARMRQERIPVRVSLHGPGFVEALKCILKLWYGPDYREHYTTREYHRVAAALGRPQRKHRKN